MRAPAMSKAGFRSAGVDAAEAHGSTSDSFGFVTCVRLPAGPATTCGRDGATAMFVVTSNNTASAKGLVEKLDQAFGNPVLIDCN